ncbi:MAG: UDP-3-O-(3-hydroxymyristoyl)glucosamine N-acyltransferase [Elusimicrobia bacterium]|nr:UDP-3-O-(3-hydroxymyristoyl)glucosamine N-acyltransferase [Elusimicrobiota bacterium]
MRLTVSQIAKLVGGTVEGDGSRLIEGAAGLEEATERDISFLGNPKYAKALKATRAGAVLLQDHLQVNNRPVIRVAHPQWAFGQVLNLLAKERERHPEGIHPSAVIDPRAKLEPGVAVGAWSVIEAGAEIGARTVVYPQCYIGRTVRIGCDCVLYPQVVIREEVTVGHRVIIHSGTVIGADGFGFAEREGRHEKIPQLGTVLIGDDVELGANVTVDRATTGSTVIGAGTKVDNLVQIAHNVQIGEHCIIVAQVGVSGSTRLGHHVTLAGQAGLTGHLRIGDRVIVAAQSGVMDDLPDGAVVFGSPARPHQEAMKIQALLGKLPELYQSWKRFMKGNADD